MDNVRPMMNERELEFAVFCIENVAAAIGNPSGDVYRALAGSSGILYQYIVPSIVPNIGKSVRPNFQCLEYRSEAQVGRIPLAQRVREAEAGVRDPTPPQLTATGKTPDGDAHVASARREGRSPLRPIHDFGEGSEPLFFSAPMRSYSV